MCIVFLAKIRDLELAVTTLLKKNFEIILSAPFPGKFKKKKRRKEREKKPEDSFCPLDLSSAVIPPCKHSVLCGKLRAAGSCGRVN